MLFGEKGESEVDLAKLARGLPVAADWSWLLKLLLRGVDRW